MTDRKMIEAQIERYAPVFIKQLADKKDDELENIGASSPSYAALSHALAAVCSYESSKKIESYSQLLTVQMDSLNESSKRLEKATYALLVVTILLLIVTVGPLLLEKLHL